MGQEVPYLAKGDSVKLGCPYALEPEDYSPSSLGIKWIQLSPDPVHPDHGVIINLPLLAVRKSWVIFPSATDSLGNADPAHAPHQCQPLAACYAQPTGELAQTQTSTCPGCVHLYYTPSSASPILLYLVSPSRAGAG